MEENDRLASQGLRVMATARKDLDPQTFDASADLLEFIDDLTILTLVGIVDPPRPQAKASIARAKAAGIQVRMITGDHAVTAETIARKLGIEGRAITGSDFAAMSDDDAVREIDNVGVIARVTPEHKVRLVDVLRKKSRVVAMTGDGVNDAPALKRADIGIAMGITGTEVSKQAAAMILTDDDFSTIVRAVELGRGLYDNLKKYIFFQMGMLAGFIVTFLGASIFNIAGGVPFEPLQTLWANFAVQVALAVGLGYGKPEEGLMARKPRAVNEAILPRAVLGWLATVGIVIGASTLAVISGETSVHGLQVARTMGLTTFTLFALFYALETRDALRSVFSLDTFEDHRFLIACGIASAAIILATTFQFFQRILQTVNLDLNQWLICIGVASSIIVVCEIQKAIRRARFTGIDIEAEPTLAVA
jgi:Ca2+-transporting ATPase